MRLLTDLQMIKEISLKLYKISSILCHFVEAMIHLMILNFWLKAKKQLLENLQNLYALSKI